MLVPSWFPRPHVSFDTVLERLAGSTVSVVIVVRGTVRDLVGNTIANLQVSGGGRPAGWRPGGAHSKPRARLAKGRPQQRPAWPGRAGGGARGAGRAEHSCLMRLSGGGASADILKTSRTSQILPRQLLFNKLIDDQYLPEAATDTTKVVQGWLLELLARHPELRPPWAQHGAAAGYGGPEWPEGGVAGGGGAGAERRLRLQVSITGHSLVRWTGLGRVWGFSVHV